MAFPALSPATQKTSANVTLSIIHLYDPATNIRTLPISVQLANHDIRRMADNRTPHTSNVPTQETHPSLLQRIIRLLRLPQRSIDIIHRRLERRELNHRIRDLPPPQRIQPLIQTPNALLLRHLPPPLPQRVRKGRDRRLHAHLDGLERTEREIGQELGARARGEVDEGFVGVGEEVVAVGVLEDFVEAVFAGALEGVADEGGGPAEEDAPDAFGAVDAAPGADVGGVDLRVDLAAAFD